MAVANTRLVWRLAKRQTLCWVTTLLLVFGISGIVMSTPPLPWPRIAMLIACTSFSLGTMWYTRLTQALRIEMQKQ